LTSPIVRDVSRPVDALKVLHEIGILQLTGRRKFPRRLCGQNPNEQLSMNKTWMTCLL